MGSFCGSGTQTVIQNSTNPNVTEQQNKIYSAINNYASRFAPNPSALVAGWNPLQIAATQGVADTATANAPWISLGEGMVGQGSSLAGMAPWLYGQGATSAGNIGQIGQTAWNPTPYESPYTQDVINATMANIQQQDAIAQNSALGNAIRQGNAFGGDRAGVAAAELARNQSLARNQTMAALQQANFNQAAQQANAQQQYLLNLAQANNAQQLQAGNLYGQLGQGMTQAGLAQGNLGYQLGNLANLGQQSALGAYQGLYNMGVGLQGTQQQMLSAPLTFGSWYGNASPGTSAVPTSTTYPGSSPLSTIAGLGVAGLGGASLLSQLGAGALFGLSHGGRVDKDAGGGVGDSAHEMVNRFHKMKSALHREVGGPTQQQPGQSLGDMGSLQATGLDPRMDPLALIRNTPPGAQRMPTSQAQGIERQLAWLKAAQDPKRPVSQEYATQQLQTMAAQHPEGGFMAQGGAIQKQDGGTSIGDPWAAQAFDKNAAFKSLMDLANSGMKYLHKQSPTQAPQAPGTSSPFQDLSSLGMGAFKLGSQLGSGQDIGAQPQAKGGRIHKWDAGAVGDGEYIGENNDIYVNPDKTQAGPGEGDDPIPISGGALTNGDPRRYPKIPPIWAGADVTAPHVTAGPVEYEGRTPIPTPTRVSGYVPTSAPAPAGGTSQAIADEINRMRLQQLRQMNSPQSTLLNFAAGFLSQGRDARGLPAPFLQQVGGGFGAVLQQRQANLQALQAQQEMALKEAKTPAEIEHIQAQTQLAKTQADKDFLLHIEEQKMKYAKQLEIEQTQQRLQMLNEMRRAGQLGNPQGTGVQPGHYNFKEFME